MKKTIYCLPAMLLLIILAGLFFRQGDLGAAAKTGKLYFSRSVKTLPEGSSYTFKVSGGKHKGKAVIWSSSDPGIAKVNKKGKVTAMKKGTVTISAVVPKSGKSVSQKLKITKKTEIPAEDTENNLITNLSEKAETMETVAWDAIGFTDCVDMNKFCYSVFKNAVSMKEKNPVISPLSAYLALVLAAEGAQGNTKAQFDSLLGNDRISDRVHQLTESLSKVSNMGNTKLSIADSVWLDDNFAADASWLSRMVNFYDAEIYQTDLCTDAARLGINRWASNKTNGLIPTLLNDNLSQEARLVLMNAIYLKAKWKYIFEETSTYKREFTNEDGNKVMTDFMNDSGDRSYFKTEDADGIILPYDDERLVFLAIRPQAGQTVRELAQNLTEKTIAGYLDSAKSTDVILHLPKFTVDYSVVMNDILNNMGLTDAFDSQKADFTGLGRGTGTFDQNLYISQVLQKVKVKVAEEGTEAAAVTAVIMDTCSAIMPEEKNPIEVDFKEPFVYIIADTKTPFGEEGKTCVPLFLGAVTEFPSE